MTRAGMKGKVVELKDREVLFTVGPACGPHNDAHYGLFAPGIDDMPSRAHDITVNTLSLDFDVAKPCGIMSSPNV